MDAHFKIHIDGTVNYDGHYFGDDLFGIIEAINVEVKKQIDSGKDPLELEYIYAGSDKDECIIDITTYIDNIYS